MHCGNKLHFHTSSTALIIRSQADRHSSTLTATTDSPSNAPLAHHDLGMYSSHTPSDWRLHWIASVGQGSCLSPHRLQDLSPAPRLRERRGVGMHGSVKSALRDVDVGSVRVS